MVSFECWCDVGTEICRVAEVPGVVPLAGVTSELGCCWNWWCCEVWSVIVLFWSYDAQWGSVDCVFLQILCFGMLVNNLIRLIFLVWGRSLLWFKFCIDSAFWEIFELCWNRWLQKALYLIFHSFHELNIKTGKLPWWLSAPFEVFRPSVRFRRCALSDRHFLFFRGVWKLTWPISTQPFLSCILFSTTFALQSANLSSFFSWD